MTTSNSDRQRKLWHALIDRGLATAIASGEPFTVERVLDSVGIHSLTLHHSIAQAVLRRNRHLTSAKTEGISSSFGCIECQLMSDVSRQLLERTIGKVLCDAP